MIHPSFGIISMSTGRFRIETFSDEATLIIMDANQSDEGHYRCVLSKFCKAVAFEGVG
jgi:hypothetical protein